MKYKHLKTYLEQTNSPTDITVASVNMESFQSLTNMIKK